MCWCCKEAGRKEHGGRGAPSPPRASFSPLPAPSSLLSPMAKCDEGYLCDVCGQDVAELTDSDLYLRYIVGMLDPEVLHTTSERHIRCNPALAQYIVADDFQPPVVVDGPFDHRLVDVAL